VKGTPFAPGPNTEASNRDRAFLVYASPFPGLPAEWISLPGARKCSSHGTANGQLSKRRQVRLSAVDRFFFPYSPGLDPRGLFLGRIQHSFPLRCVGEISFLGFRPPPFPLDIPFPPQCLFSADGKRVPPSNRSRVGGVNLFPQGSRCRGGLLPDAFPGRRTPSLLLPFPPPPNEGLPRLSFSSSCGGACGSALLRFAVVLSDRGVPPERRFRVDALPASMVFTR